jgi:hypothetical protein
MGMKGTTFRDSVNHGTSAAVNVDSAAANGLRSKVIVGGSTHRWPFGSDNDGGSVRSDVTNFAFERAQSAALDYGILTAGDVAFPDRFSNRVALAHRPTRTC